MLLNFKSLTNFTSNRLLFTSFSALLLDPIENTSGFLSQSHARADRIELDTIRHELVVSCRTDVED
jgi:hypothetical protein